jgi:hypothetical protein
MPPHECKQTQEVTSMGRQLKVLFGLIGLLLVMVGYSITSASTASERAQTVEKSQAAMQQDIGWIKETLVEIKAEVKKKP